VISGVEKPRAVSADRFSYPSPIIVDFVRFISLLISKALWFIRYSGRKNIPTDDRGIVVVSNHPTYLDPVWITLPIRKKLRYMAWDEAFEWRLIGRLIRYLGAFPVKHRKGITKSAVVESIRSLRDGAALVIFPEGEREFADGKMLEFKTGAVHIALNSGVPILPVSVRGGNRIWPQRRKYPRLFRRVEIVYHPLMHLPEKPEEVELDKHLEKLNNDLVDIIDPMKREIDR